MEAGNYHCFAIPPYDSDGSLYAGDFAYNFYYPSHLLRIMQLCCIILITKKRMDYPFLLKLILSDNAVAVFITLSASTGTFSSVILAVGPDIPIAPTTLPR